MGFIVKKRVLRRVLRRGSEKGVSRRCLERPLEEYAPLGVRPNKDNRLRSSGATTENSSQTPANFSKGHPQDCPAKDAVFLCLLFENVALRTYVYICNLWFPSGVAVLIFNLLETLPLTSQICICMSKSSSRRKWVCLYWFCPSWQGPPHSLSAQMPLPLGMKTSPKKKKKSSQII